MAVDMSTLAPHVYADRQERLENGGGKPSLIFNPTEWLELLVEGYFIKTDRWQELKLGGKYPVRAHTWRITHYLKTGGYNFSPVRVRNACRRLSEKGVLEIDEYSSAVNSICWRYLK